MLAKSPDTKVAAMAKDVKLVKSLAGVLNASLKMGAAAKDPLKLGIAMADKGLKMADTAGTAADSKGLKVAAGLGSQTIKTLGLLKVANMTPAKAGVYITFAVADKMIAAAGIADTKTLNKCHMAVASLATTAGISALTVAGSGGLATAAAAIAIASEAFNVYGQCYAVPNAK